MLNDNKLKIGGSSGMTLVELMVASAVLVLILGVISTLLIKVFYIDRYTIEQGMNIAALQNSLKSVSTNLREAKQSDAGGYLLEKADKDDLVFYANIDNDPATERIHYYIQATTLKMGISKPSGFPASYPAADQIIKTIGTGIANRVDQPLFYYFNKDYPIDTQHNPLTTPAVIESVKLIKIDIYANIDPNHAPNSMRMETFIRPRNIK